LGAGAEVALGHRAVVGVEPRVSSGTTVTSPSPPSGTSEPTPPPAHPARYARVLARRGDQGDDATALEEA